MILHVRRCFGSSTDSHERFHHSDEKFSSFSVAGGQNRPLIIHLPLSANTYHIYSLKAILMFISHVIAAVLKFGATQICLEVTFQCQTALPVMAHKDLTLVIITFSLRAYGSQNNLDGSTANMKHLNQIKTYFLLFLKYWICFWG